MEHRSDSSHFGLEDAYIGCRVREARAEYGMTREELASDVGVDPKHISRIENGRKHGSDQLIRRISEVTGKPLSFFYGNDPLPKNASAKEIEILMKYRKATVQQQKLIESLIDAVYESVENKPPESGKEKQSESVTTKVRRKQPNLPRFIFYPI